MTKILLENKTGITFIPCLLTLIILTLQCILHDFLKKKKSHPVFNLPSGFSIALPQLLKLPIAQSLRSFILFL